MAQLFPVFEVPDIRPASETQERKYRPSLDFDFDIGDFRVDVARRLQVCDGREAWLQWCIKTVMTERLACMAYGSDIGTEMQAAMSRQDVQAVQSDIERTITEALMANPRTEYVRGFSFVIAADAIYCEFIVKGRDWEEQPIKIDCRHKEVLVWQHRSLQPPYSWRGRA